MCIAIYKPQGIELYEDTLQNCWEANSDGAGFMYAEKGKLHIEKGFFKFENFMEEYSKHAKKQAVIHFRIRTHGDINVENCHPYPVDENLAFVHNGTINTVSGDDLTKSDTWHFNEQILKPIRKRYKSFFKDDLYTTIIDNFIGWSKLIFLNSKGEYSIVNEKAGEWDSGCWFSNGSWKTNRRTYTKPEPKQISMTLTNDYEDYEYLPAHGQREEDYVGSIISIGDICWIVNGYTDLKSGDYVKIKYVYTDMTAGCIPCDNETKEYRIPMINLVKTSIPILKDTYKHVGQSVIKTIPEFEEGDVVLFTQNWNHFRTNMDAKIISVTTDDCSVIEDQDNFRTYTVPNSVLKLWTPFSDAY